MSLNTRRLCSPSSRECAHSGAHCRRRYSCAFRHIAGLLSVSHTSSSLFHCFSTRPSLPFCKFCPNRLWPVSLPLSMSAVTAGRFLSAPSEGAHRRQSLSLSLSPRAIPLWTSPYVLISSLLPCPVPHGKSTPLSHSSLQAAAPCDTFSSSHPYTFPLGCRCGEPCAPTQRDLLTSEILISHVHCVHTHVTVCLGTARLCSLLSTTVTRVDGPSSSWLPTAIEPLLCVFITPSLTTGLPSRPIVR